MFSSRKGKKLYKTPSVKYNVCTNKKLTQVCLQNVKFLFFFLFKLFTKSSWKSERQLPLQGLKSIKTTTEQLKQSEREKEKETMSNVWHLVLSTGFPRAPLGIENKIYWQTRLLNTQEGEPQRLLPTEAALCSQTVGCTAVSQAGASGLFHPITLSGKLSSLPYTGPLCLAALSKSGLKHNTGQPAGSGKKNPVGIPSFFTPSVNDAEQCLPTPQVPRYTLPPFPGQFCFPALPPTSM